MQRPTLPSTRIFLLIFTWILGGALLSLPTIINEFPFIYYDSGYYFLIGIFDAEPWLIIWRPIVYGLIIGQYLSLGGALYNFVFVQNLLLAGLLLFFCKDLMQDKYKNRIFLLIVLGSFLSPLPWISNFILPDFFSGLIPLFIAAFLLRKNVRRQAVMAVGALLSLIMHHSNMIASILLTPLLWLKYGSVTLKRLLIATLILPWFIVPLIHGAKTQSFSVSNASHAILFSRFMALGVAQEYLADLCLKEKKQHALCQYHKSGFDLWDWANTTYKDRTIGKLESGIQDFRSVNWGILTGKYLFVYLARGLNNSLVQLFSSSEPLDAPLYSNLIEAELRKLNLDNYKRYRNQKLTEEFLPGWRRPMEFTFNHTAVYSVVLLLLLFAWGKMDIRIQKYFTVCLLFFAMNALTIGFFTDPMPRYSIRISWVFFFLFMIQLALLLQEPSKTRETW